MKQPSEVGKLARAVSGQRAGLTVREMAQVRVIAATANLRTGSRRRALLFGGEVGISGTPGQGTRVTVSIPMPR